MEFISCKIEEFIDKYSGTSILCFGSGSYFQIMLWDFEERRAGIQIDAVIDNNHDKWGTEIFFDEKKIPVLSLEKAAKKYLQNATAILITSASHQEMLDQLMKLPVCSEICVYSYFDIKKNSQTFEKSFPCIKNEINIPKKIHYCWFGGKEIPKHLQECIDTWKKYCPEYELIQWNENNYNIDKNFYVKTSYQKGKLGFLPDYVRLDVVYHYGGIYLDTDVELLKPLDSLLGHSAFFGAEISGGINEGSGFGAIKNHKLIKELKGIYEEIEEETPFLFNTCMGKEIQIFHQYGYRNNGKFQEIEKTAFYPFYILAPKIKESGEKLVRTNTIGIHHFDGSWCEKK